MYGAFATHTEARVRLAVILTSAASLNEDIVIITLLSITLILVLN